MSTSTSTKLHLSKEHGLSLLREMMLIRRFEEKCAELYSAQKIRGFLHLYIGEEANAVGIMRALEPNDAVVATYREHGHAIARGLPVKEVMAEMYGKATGSSGGRGGSMHIFDGKYRFYGGNAIVGGGLSLAVGLALADKMQNRNNVTCCFFGEGAAAEGAFHESLNLAALWKLPVLFVCENNGYAMGTALDRSESNVSIAEHAKSYGISAKQIDGMNVVDVEVAAYAAVAEIRVGNGPQFLENITYRFRAHSMFDAELYRGKAEVEEWKSRGPIVRFSNWLREVGLVHEADITNLEMEIEEIVEDAVAFAEGSAWEEVATLTHNVYTEPSDMKAVS